MTPDKPCTCPKHTREALPDLKRYGAGSVELSGRGNTEFYECRDVDALLAELWRDAERYRFLTNLPKIQAQAFFWNWDSRKDRAKAIDSAMKANT